MYIASWGIAGLLLLTVSTLLHKKRNNMVTCWRVARAYTQSRSATNKGWVGSARAQQTRSVLPQGKGPARTAQHNARDNMHGCFTATCSNLHVMLPLHPDSNTHRHRSCYKPGWYMHTQAKSWGLRNQWTQCVWCMWGMWQPAHAPHWRSSIYLHMCIRT